MPRLLRTRIGTADLTGHPEDHAISVSSMNGCFYVPLGRARANRAGNRAVSASERVKASAGAEPGFSLEKLVFVGVRRGSRSRGQVEFVEDVAQVPFDGPLADEELRCDLPVGLARRDQPQHLDLARA